MNDFFLNYPDNKLRNCITNDILSNSDSLKYHKTLEEYSPTPLYDLKNLARELGVGKIYVKDESKRFNLNAFKGLGASYAVHKVLSLYPNISVFCTATDGNHGRAVAWSATKHNKKSIIYVPKQTTEARIKAIANHGSEVIQLDLNYQDTCQYASNISKKMNWTLIQDTSWENYEKIPAYIMSGYLTHLREMEDSINTLDHPGVDIIFLQCGVGSWPATCIWYYINRYFKKKPKIVLVEPDESSGMLQSLLSNKRITPKGSLDTIMAGLNCGIPSMSGWEIIKSGCDAAISISDEYAKRAIRALYFPIKDDERVISGESGAAGLGGLIKCLEVNKSNVLRKHIGLNSKSEILFINTEGNTDPESFKSIISSN